jgi:transcriptional regulator with XRE-family HTH domain
MGIFADNLRFLREKKDLSQQKLADKLIITRIRLAKYEQGVSEPPFDVLKRITAFFNISIDVMISVDLKTIPADSLLKMEDNRILLPIVVDKTGKDFIEIVPFKAKAGYLLGYSDPEFIESLQVFQLPFLKNGKYRAFPIEGDSMPPHKEGSFIVGRYVEKLSDVKDGRTYIVLSKNDGIVYKRIARKNKRENTFILQSDNPVYQPYEIRPSEILEVWEYAVSISTKEFEPDDLTNESIKEMLRELRIDIGSIKKSVVK